MEHRRFQSRALARSPLALALIGAIAGCGHPSPREADAAVWPYRHPVRIAVAPALNFSGESELDPVVLADLLASELTRMRGVSVVPVSRVAAAMNRDGGLYVRSPQHALAVCRAVGSDGILIPAITEYHPYPPMRVGLALELYTLPMDEDRPGAAADSAAIGAAARTAPTPLAQIQAVFDAGQGDVERAVRRFGEPRDKDAGAMGWKRYLWTQDGYLRFCFSEGLRKMVLGDSYHMPPEEPADG